MHSMSAEAHRRKVGVAMLSIVSNSILILLKLTVGLLIGSVSIISEAIHSMVDLFASVVAFISVRASAKPADSHHPFGHGKFENLSGTIEALLILAAAVWIIIEALAKLRHPQSLDHAWVGAGIMMVSATLNWLVSRRLFQIGKETDSIALQADGWHLRTDVYTSAGVMVGLIIIGAGRLLAPGLHLDWVDPAAALCVAVMISHAAITLTRDSVRDLVDARLPEDEESWIHDLVRGYMPAVHGMHGLRTRKGGATRFVEFHLIVAKDMPVLEAHALSDTIEEAIVARYSEAHVTIHIEPCAPPCPPACIPGCFRPDLQPRE